MLHPLCTGAGSSPKYDSNIWLPSDPLIDLVDVSGPALEKQIALLIFHQGRHHLLRVRPALVPRVPERMMPLVRILLRRIDLPGDRVDERLHESDLLHSTLRRGAVSDERLPLRSLTVKLPVLGGDGRRQGRSRGAFHRADVQVASIPRQPLVLDRWLFAVSQFELDQFAEAEERLHRS